TCQCPTTTTATTAEESGQPQRYLPNGGWNADWTAPLTNRFLLEGVMYTRFTNTRRPHPAGLPDVCDSLDEVVAWNREAITKNLIGINDQALGINYHANIAS